MLINRYRSLFLLIRVRSGPARFAIPLPLFIITQILEAVAGWCWLWETLLPKSLKRLENKHPFFPKDGRPLTAGLKLIQELIKELRRYGKWRMVEVYSNKGDRCNDARVYIDFI